MATYTLISSNVLSSSAASVTFSAIPATYTDLVIRASARTDRADYEDYCYVRFNGDTSSLYSLTDLKAQGGSASSAQFSNQSGNFFFYATASTATANTFGSEEVYVPSYTASQSKPFSLFTVSENNSSTNHTIDVNAGLYRSNTAISSITMQSYNSANFVSGSSFYLYGISNA